MEGGVLQVQKSKPTLRLTLISAVCYATINCLPVGGLWIKMMVHTDHLANQTVLKSLKERASLQKRAVHRSSVVGGQTNGRTNRSLTPVSVRVRSSMKIGFVSKVDLHAPPREDFLKCKWDKRRARGVVGSLDVPRRRGGTPGVGAHYLVMLLMSVALPQRGACV